MKRLRLQRVILVCVGIIVLAGTLYYFAGSKITNMSRSMIRRTSTDGEGDLSVQVYDPGTTCITVEGGDDEFSKCARSIVYGDGTDGTTGTKQAVATLNKCLSTNNGKGIFVGHGYMGSIRTGGGAGVPTRDQIMTAVRPSDWTESLGELKGKARELTLFGCWTGAEAKGRSLVDKISEATGAKIVRAQNSVVFCDAKNKRFYQDAMATWADSSSEGVQQSGNPSVVARRVADLSSYKCLRLVGPDSKNGQGLSKMPPEAAALKRIDIAGINLVLPDFKPGKQAPFEFIALATKQLLDEIDFCNPVLSLVPDLRPTGTFDLTISDQTRHFTILDDTMVQDADHPEALYWLKRDDFESFKKQLRTELDKL
jgi:hypothetical protein